MITQLFPPADELDVDPDAVIQARRRFGNFSTDKLKQIVRISEDYSALSTELYAHPSGAGDLTKTDRAQLALLESEKQRDIQNALTPDEYTEYQLHNSSTAQRLRS